MEGADINHTKKGFTLIEVLVVVSIMGILLVVAAGTLGREWGVGARSAQQQVLAVIGQARAHAIARGVPTAVVIAGDEQEVTERYRKLSYLEVTESDGGNFAPAEKDGALVTRWLRLPKGMVFLPQVADEKTVYDQGSEIAGVRQAPRVTRTMTAVVFGSRGQILEPREDVWIYLARGAVNKAGGIQRFGGDDAVAQRILLHRLTGRAKGMEAR